MPILSSTVFDNTGHPYNVSRILTPEYLFDQKAYEEYSPVYLPITYVLSYGVQFAALTSLVTHTFCWYGKDIWQQTRKAFKERHGAPDFETYQPLRTEDHPQPSSRNRDSSRNGSYDSSPDMPLGMEDVHCRLMRRYNDAPLAWYLIVLITMLGIATYTVEQYVFRPQCSFIPLFALTYLRLKLSCPSSLVRLAASFGDHQHFLHTGWYHHGRHQPAQQSLPDLPAPLWHRISRPPCREHGLCHLLLYQLRARHQILLGLETRSLHEGPTSNSIRSANFGDLGIELDADRCTELDVCLHSRPVHPTGNQWVQLSHCTSAFQRQRPLGGCWTATFLWP